VEAKFILWKETLKDCQRICFLFVDWANWKFFFLWKKCFVSQLFFLAFERTLLIVLLQLRRMKVKATMRQISFGQKNKEKSKKLQYGWVSVDCDMILVEHSKWLRMRLKYYELHQTPHERQKAKLIFCRGPHDLRPQHHGKKRKDASTDSGLGASAQTLVLRRMKVYFFELTFDFF